MIKEYEKAFPDRLVYDINKVLEGKEFIEVNNGVQKGVLTCDLEPEDLPFKGVEYLGLKMAEEYFSNFLPIPYDLFIEAFTLLRYPENTYCELHCDREWVKNGNKEVVRLINLIIFLNDDFVGGNLIFQDQNLVFGPTVGNAVGFPCSFLVPHRVSMVLNGVRDVLSLSIGIGKPVKSY